MTESVAYPGGSARRQSIGEAVLNAISHGIGAVMAVIGTVLLVLRAKEEGDLLNIISVAIFGRSTPSPGKSDCLFTRCNPKITLLFHHSSKRTNSS
ncbi:hypothetical protein [Evtepia gabavorous]|uniref:hypothetical protein n=1 Tax=Evtepia gabavorous TaxID=2211183 RepID=UPI003A934662